MKPFAYRRYDYRLKFTLSGAGTGLNTLVLSHDIQHSQRALPALDKGANTIHFSTGPAESTVTIEANGQGIAATSGTRVTVSAKWIKQQEERGPQNESVGSVVHEAVHVAQQYGGARGRNRVPGWLTEGIADYVRWWKYEPASVRRPVAPIKRNGQPASYTDSYQTTAAFLEFVAKNHDHEIVVKLNAAGRNASYSPDLWKKYTGKTVEELWTQFVETLKK